MSGLALDFRLALRRLAGRPGTTAVFIVTLALGLSAAATATGVVRALLLRPLPFTTLDRLVLVRDDVPVTGIEQRAPVTPVDVVALQAHGRAFERVAAFRFRTRTIGVGAEAEPLHVAEVSASFWPALDVAAAAGWTFGPDAEKPGRDDVVVLNETFWRERLGGRSVLGQTIRIDGRPFTVVGVVAQRYPLGVEAWVPLVLSPAQWNDGTARNLQVLALIRPGVAVSAAEADARRVATDIAARHPDTHRERSLRLLPLRAEQYEFTLALFSVVELVALAVLLVAAANSVTIMTVKVVDSGPDAAVRTALGASLRRIVQPYAIEAVLLSLCAGLLAVVATGWTLPFVRRGVPPGIAKWIAGWDAVQPDASLAITTWGIAAAIGIGVGMWSGVRGARGDLAASIATDGRTVGRTSGRGRKTALAIQAGVSVVLLSAAVLFHGGLEQVRRAFAACDPDRVLLARVNAPAHRFPAETDVVSFFERAAAAAGTLHGVAIAGLIRNAPASNVPSPTRGVWSVEEPPAPGTPAATADIQIADPRGLAAVGVAIVSGRAFLDSDTEASSPVALVSRQLANRLWGARGALGRVIVVDDGTRWRVVGVAEDVRLNWYDGGPRPTIYLPHAQTAARSMTLVLRAATVRPETLARPLVAALQDVDRDPPPLRLYTLRQEVNDSLAPLMTIAWLLAALALVALGLAAADMYALAAAVVALRTREMGLRMALGAEPRSLVRLVLGAVARPVALGAALGVPSAAALARWLGTHTFGLLALDPFVPVAIGAILLAAAALGAWHPARRAARSDPIVALRQ